MIKKAELMALIAEYAQRRDVHSAVEATRIATDRKDRGAGEYEKRLKDECKGLRTNLERVVSELPIE